VTFSPAINRALFIPLRLAPVISDHNNPRKTKAPPDLGGADALSGYSPHRSASLIECVAGNCFRHSVPTAKKPCELLKFPSTGNK